MKTLNFTFSHPVKVKVIISSLAQPKLPGRSFIVDSKNNQVNIPVEHLRQGKWKLTMNWQHDEKDFRICQEFEVPGKGTAHNTMSLRRISSKS